MSYNFTPMTEEEINAANLMEEGIYNFEVVKSSYKTSKAGNPMAELNIMVWDHDGKQKIIFDYLIFSHVPLNIKKVKHFCDTVGLQEEYKKGQIPEDLERLSGKVKIIIQKGQLIPEDKLQGKPKGSCYPDKNAVEDYVMTDKGAVKQEANPSKEVDDFFDDEIPF